MLYQPPDIFSYPLSHCLPDLSVFIHLTHYYDFLAYNRPPATRPLHYWYHNLVSSELLISIIYFAFICIHDYRLLIKRFPLSSRCGGFFGVAWRVRRFSSTAPYLYQVFPSSRLRHPQPIPVHPAPVPSQTPASIPPHHLNIRQSSLPAFPAPSRF